MTQKNEKKLAKLRSKVEAIDQRMKADLACKRDYQRQIAEIEEEEKMNMVRSTKATPTQFRSDIEMGSFLREHGISMADLRAFVDAKSDNPSDVPEKTPTNAIPTAKGVF